MYRKPQYIPPLPRRYESTFTPDMVIGLDEAENAPDMTFSVEEAERPDMAFAPQWLTSEPTPVAVPADPPAMRISDPRTAIAAPQPDPEVERQYAAALAQQPAARPAFDSMSVQPLDPELDAQWRNAERTALSRSGYSGDQPYSFGEGVRDFAPMAIGAALDGIFNKGRGLGAVFGGGMQALQGERSRRQAEAKNAAGFALDARNQRQDEMAQQLRGGESALGWANLMERREMNARLAEAQRFALDPNHPQAAAMRDYMQKLSGVDTAGLSTKQQGQGMGMATNVQELALAPHEAAAREQAVSDVRHENAPRMAADEVAKQVAIEQGTRQEKAVTQQLTQDITNPMLDATGSVRMPQGIADNAQFQELARRDPKLGAQIIQTYDDMVKLEKLSQELIPLRDQIDAIPIWRRTRADAEFADLIGQWDEREGAYQAALFEAQNRGVPQSFEQTQYNRKVGAPIGWEDVPFSPMDSARAAVVDEASVLRGRSKAATRAREQFVQKRFGAQGDPSKGQAQQPPNTQPDSGYKYSVDPNSPTLLREPPEPETLRTQPNPPPIPIQGKSVGLGQEAGGVANGIAVISPNGAPGVVTPEQWEQLKNKPGWRQR